MVYGYKLYDRSTGKFYRGGGRWNKTGKVWARLGDLTLALHVSEQIAKMMKKRAACLELVELVDGGRPPFMEIYDSKLNRRKMPL